MINKNKKESSERKRIESLQQRENLSKQKSLAISNSLKQIAPIKKNHLFSDTKSNLPNKKIKLFKDDSDISDFEEAFDIKNINVKNKALKLLKQVNDNRFKIDENFLDSNDLKEATNNSQQLETDEKSHNLAILNSIIGFKPSKGKNNSFKDIEQFRYDPEAVDHQRFELDAKVKSSKPKISTKALTQTNNLDPPNVSKDQFSEINPDLKASFKSGQTFKLSALFADDDDVCSTKEDLQHIPQNRNYTKNHLFSDSSEDEELIKELKEPVVETLKSIADTKLSSKFFFEKNDVRLTTNFYRSSNLETLKADWLNKRQFYVDSYRKRKRHHR